MGGGDNYNNEDTIGRIGIGALSIFALGDKVAISTRTQGDDKVLMAELNFEKVKNESEHSTPLENIRLGDIKGYRKATEDDEEHFTEIVVSSLSKTVLDIFNDSDKTKELIERLERILPVPYRSDDLIFERLPKEIADKIRADKFVIKNVELHIPHLGYANPDYKVYRKTITSVETARIIHTPPIFPFNIEGGSHRNLAVYGYLYINGDKVLPKGWQGINARIKNVTIESNTFFNYEEDPASRNRIGGEVFIVNIDENHAITTNRSGFAIENSDYVLVSQYMQGRIEEATNIVRRHSAVDSIVKKFINAVDKLRSVFETNASTQDARDDNSTFKELDDKAVVLKREVPFSLENVLKNELDKKSIDFELIWSGILPESYYIQPQEDQFYTIYVHERLYQFMFNVAGNSIEYVIAYCDESNPLLIKKHGKVYLNLDNKLVANKDITKVEVGFVETVLALYLNYLRCNKNADLLYSQTISDLLRIL
jgi:hypothetical protein